MKRYSAQLAELCAVSTPIAVRHRVAPTTPDTGHYYAASPFLLKIMKTIYVYTKYILGLGFLPSRLRIPALFLVGVIFGLGGLLVHISRATSYLSDSPETCMNCHVMTDAYLSWKHSSHRQWTTCNDCHVPHTSIPREYAFKAHDGLRHASIFTLRIEPQVIKLSHGAIPVVQENCVRCHEARVAEVSACRYEQGDLRCWDCHREVPHSRVHSLSASPDRFRPQLPLSVPDVGDDKFNEFDKNENQ